MGNGLRIFLIHDNNSLCRLSLARFERLLRRETKESLPQYAGKRIRYAIAILSLSGRKPLAINRIDYSILSFDAEGRIDISERERQTRLAIESMPPLLEQKDHLRQVIDARRHFAKKRYEHDFKWTPSPAIEAAIAAAIFGNISC